MANKSAQMAEWASKRNAKIYLTADGHPLQTNDCEHVTTPDLYANGVKKLHYLGFRIVDRFTIPDRFDISTVDVIRIGSKKSDDPSKDPMKQPWAHTGPT